MSLKMETREYTVVTRMKQKRQRDVDYGTTKCKWNLQVAYLAFTQAKCHVPKHAVFPQSPYYLICHTNTMYQ